MVLPEMRQYFLIIILISKDTYKKPVITDITGLGKTSPAKQILHYETIAYFHEDRFTFQVKHL